MNDRFDKIVPGLQNKLHLLVDLSLAAVGVLLAIQFQESRFHPHTMGLIMTAGASWFITAAATRLYSPCTPRRLWDNLTLRLIGAVIATAAIVVMDSAMPANDVRLASPLAFVVFVFCSGAIGRMMVFKPLSRFAKPVQDVLIVGTGHLAVSTYENLRHAEPERRANVVGFLALENQPMELAGVAAPVLGRADVLLDILSTNPVSEVYIAGRITEHGNQMQELVSSCERVGMPFALPLHALRFERAKLLSSSPARDGYLHYMSTAWKPMQYALKRVIDIVASATALLVLSPMLLGVAAAIKITSPGPVLFKQKRVGLHGATFDLLKFRSMVTNAEALKAKLMAQNEQTGPVFKMKNDPRITGIGHFIRKYSIDELPQLVNILRGDMTIVGPRPAVPSEVAQYKAWQRRRLSVRPGLTCYWQVGGRNSIGFEDWMRLDLRYVDNWSLAVDMHLILQTFPAVLAGKGAS